MSIQTNPTYGHIQRSNLKPGLPSDGPIAVTTSVATVLSPPDSLGVRWITSGARVVNYTDETPAILTLYYVPDGISRANSHIVGKFRVQALDSVLLGEFPLMAGYTLQAVASVDSALNLFLPYEEEI